MKVLKTISHKHPHQPPLSNQYTCSPHMKGVSTVVNGLEMVSTRAPFDQNCISCLVKIMMVSLSSNAQMLLVSEEKSS